MRELSITSSEIENAPLKHTKIIKIDILVETKLLNYDYK